MRRSIQHPVPIKVSSCDAKAKEEKILTASVEPSERNRRTLRAAAIANEFLREDLLNNKTPAKAFILPAKTKMGTRPGRAVTTAFIKDGVYSLISVVPNKFLFKSVIIRVPSKAF